MRPLLLPNLVMLSVLLGPCSGCNVSDFDKRTAASDEAGAPPFGETGRPDADPDAASDGAAGSAGEQGEAGLEGTVARDAGQDAESADDAPDAGPAPDAEIRFDDAGCRVAADGGRVAAPFGRASPFVELARVRDPALVSRVLGPSAVLGGKPLFAFSFTYGPPDPAPPARTPANYPVGAFATDDRPWTRDASDSTRLWQLETQLTMSGNPLPFVSLLADQSPAIMLVPQSIVRAREGSQQGLVFGLIGGLGQKEAVFLADVDPDSMTATQRAEPLFRETDPLFVHGAHRGTRYTKLFACRGEAPERSCAVARAPRDAADQRSAYEALIEGPDGALVWDKDLRRAVPVLQDVGGDLSVSWNPHLQTFLAVHSVAFGNEIVLQTAHNVEGPWTRVAAVPVPPPRVSWPAIHGREHPLLAQRCGSRIIVSYYEPNRVSPDRWPYGGEVVLGAIDLLE